jgi:transcriptional regulator with XRE-family HTH domain
MSETGSAAFGAMLLRLRAEAGLTQEQLAARAGLSPNAIAALERGRRRAPRGATVELLAGALELEGDTRASSSQQRGALQFWRRQGCRLARGATGSVTSG